MLAQVLEWGIDMIDKFLEIGGSADLITPLWAFVQDIYYGQPYQIGILHDCGMSAGQIERSLRSKGVRVWGMLVIGKTITFTVRRPQAQYALYWLRRWGVT